MFVVQRALAGLRRHLHGLSQHLRGMAALCGLSQPLRGGSSTHCPSYSAQSVPHNPRIHVRSVRLSKQALHV